MKAIAKFIEHCSNAQTIANEIAMICDDHLGNTPDEINWGHVGDAARIERLLSEILDSIKQ